MSEASEELTITTLLARLCEGQEKTLKALDAINSRVNALESKPTELTHHPRGIIDPSNPPPVLKGPAPQELAMRCEMCNDIYTALPPAFGTPRNCEECRIPGRSMSRCDCGRVFAQPDSTETKCRKCRRCFICGTKESREVCAVCQTTKRARACDACNKLASPNSSFCDDCQRAFGAKSAGNFNEVTSIPPDPRAMQEGTLAEMSGLRFADAAPAYPR